MITAMSSKDRVTIMAVGDIMMGEHPIRIGHGVGSMVKKMGGEFLFKEVAPVLQEGDISFGNLEAVLSAKNLRKVSLSSLQLRASSNSINGLKIAGFNVLSLANNHSMQHGPDAFNETVDILDKNNIRPVGLSDTSNSCIPQIIEKNGISIGFLGYSFIDDKLPYKPLYAKVSSLASIIEEVKALSEKVDIIVLSLHWGDEYIQRPSPEQVRLVHKLVDNGVNIILGHHSHCLQGIERYKSGLIAYSLGNFVFDYWQNKMRESIILQIVLSKEGVVDYSLQPVYINDNFQPEILRNERGLKLLSKLSSLSNDAMFSTSAEELEKYKAEALSEKREWRNDTKRYFIKNFYKYPIHLLLQLLTGKIQRSFSKSIKGRITTL